MFPIIILIGRPAAGKSEVIDYLKHLPQAELARLHITAFEEIDDFPWVWQMFEDDDVRETLGRERQNTTRDHYFKDPFLWDWLIGKINLEFAKRVAQDPDYANRHTTMVEFSRGGENAYGEALGHLSDEILSRAVVLYVRVPFEESLRRNRRRARPGQEGSILYHSLSDEKMETLYRTDDWDRLSGGRPTGVIPIKGHTVPFAEFLNDPEKTDAPAKLGPALQEAIGHLWNARNHTGS